MGSQWKTLLLLAVVVAVSATLGGLLNAVRRAEPSSADTGPAGVGTVDPGAENPAVDTEPIASSGSRPDVEPEPEKNSGSPWNSLFGGGDGGKGGRGKRSSKPDYTAEFRIDEKTPPIEFISASNGLPTAGEWRGRPAFGDMDRDGNLDIVCSIRKGDGLHVFYGDGKGRWTERETEWSTRLGYGGSEVADFNRDGFLDIVFTTHGAPVQVFFGDGDGGWKRANEGVNNNQIMEDVAVADFNGDGHLDFVCIGWAHAGINMFYGHGDGTWETVDLFPADDELFGHEIISGDINKDGHQDFVVAMGGPRVFLGDGKGAFRPSHRSLPIPLTKGTNFGLALGDVTGDGTLEIAVCFSAMEGMRGLAVYDQQEDGAWKSISGGLPLETSFTDAEFGDFDGDGKLDLVAYTGYNVLVWRGDGGKNWTPAGRVGDVGRAGDLGVADINGDGSEDIVVIHRHGAAGVLALLKR